MVSERRWNQRVTKNSGRNASSDDSAQRRVEPEQHTADHHHRQQAGDQVVDARLEGVADGLQVTGHPGDDPARGVLLVEGHAQPLGVVEDPGPQPAQHVLRDPAGHPDEDQPGQRAGHGGEQVQPDGEEQRPTVTVDQRRNRSVDAVGDEQRTGDRHGLVEQDDQPGQDQPSTVRAGQLAHQLPAAAGELRTGGLDVAVGCGGAVVADAPPVGAGGGIVRQVAGTVLVGRRCSSESLLGRAVRSRSRAMAGPLDSSAR